MFHNQDIRPVLYSKRNEAPCPRGACMLVEGDMQETDVLANMQERDAEWWEGGSYLDGWGDDILAESWMEWGCEETIPNSE